MQALMLAAGMGRRLGKYTDNQTKCMVKVGGKTLLERTIDAIKEAGINRLIIVAGFEAQKLVDYVKTNFTGIEVEFVFNKDYAKTNNVYSLYLARDLLSQDDTILLESDLIYDSRIIREMVECSHKNLVAVAKYEQWMDGTVTLVNKNNEIVEFIEKKKFKFIDAGNYYKTVNIYKFSKEFSNKQYIPFLKAYIQAYGKNQYYEMVLKALAHLPLANLTAFNIGDAAWYEIDDAQDLNIANTLFAPDEDKLYAYEHHFGGYWRFPGLIDFCYLVNPYFPPQKMLDHLKFFFDTLLRDYPSGMDNQILGAARMFQIDERYLLVGNGAAELINTLGRMIKGKVAISIPAFNEYLRCFPNCEFNFIYTRENDFAMDKNQLIKMSKNCDAIVIINPDNPSGSFLSKKDIIEILDACKLNDTICIIDESFIDFADNDKRYTLLVNEILENYPKLVVVKSISKSYGVPGLRLGVLASSDTRLLKELRKLLPIWNINSFAEYFLQIFGYYENQYRASCDCIAQQRMELIIKLRNISYLKVYDSQANYLLCEVTTSFTSMELANRLLKENKLLIKNLSNKDGFSGRNYIRIAVKDEEENNILYNALMEIDKERFSKE